MGRHKRKLRGTEAAKLTCSVHLCFKAKTENTTNPDVTPLRCLCRRCCILCLSFPSVFNLDFTRHLAAFLAFPQISHCGAATWMVETVESKYATLCSVKSTCRVVCLILAVLFCCLLCTLLGHGRAPDGKRATDGLFCSLCNSSIFEFNSAAFMIEFISSVL